jgi:hypothetical protein
MKDYDIKVGNGYLTVSADEFIITADGLRFFQNREIIAWFRIWDYFILSRPCG